MVVMGRSGFRLNPLIVHVRDSDGYSVPNATVKIKNGWLNQAAKDDSQAESHATKTAVKAAGEGKTNLVGMALIYYFSGIDLDRATGGRNVRFRETLIVSAPGYQTLEITFERKFTNRPERLTNRPDASRPDASTELALMVKVKLKPAEQGEDTDAE